MRIRTFMIDYNKRPESEPKHSDQQLVRSTLKKQIDEAQKVLDNRKHNGKTVKLYPLSTQWKKSPLHQKTLSIATKAK